MRQIVFSIACAIAALSSTTALAVPQIGVNLGFRVESVFTRGDGSETGADDPSILLSIRTADLRNASEMTGGGSATFSAGTSSRTAGLSGTVTAIGGVTTLSVVHDVELVFSNLDDDGDLRFSFSFNYVSGKIGSVENLSTQYVRAEYTQFNVGPPAQGSNLNGEGGFRSFNEIGQFFGASCDTRELQFSQTVPIPFCFGTLTDPDSSIFGFQVRYEDTDTVVVPVRLAFNLAAADVPIPASLFLLTAALVGGVTLTRRHRRGRELRK